MGEGSGRARAPWGAGLPTTGHLQRPPCTWSGRHRHPPGHCGGDSTAHGARGSRRRISPERSPPVWSGLVIPGQPVASPEPGPPGTGNAATPASCLTLRHPTGCLPQRAVGRKVSSPPPPPLPQATRSLRAGGGGVQGTGPGAWGPCGPGKGTGASVHQQVSQRT